MILTYNPSAWLALLAILTALTLIVGSWRHRGAPLGGSTRIQQPDIMPIARDAILKSMIDGVIVLDAGKRIIELNPAAQRIIERKTQEVIGQHYG
jgi:PAS domain-containing protein